MTTTTTFCPVSRRLGRTPEVRIPAIPYLLGYRPEDSLVCLFVSDGDLVTLTTRVDWEEAASAPDDVAIELAARASEAGAGRVLVAAVDVTTPDWRLLARLCDAFTAAGLAIEWAGICTPTTWRGLECDDRCDPHLTDVAAESVVRLVAAGHAPAPDRRAVLAEVAADDLRLTDLGAAAVPSRPMDREIWRDLTIEDCLAMLRSSARASDLEVARFCAGMADIRVRDVVLWRMTAGSDRDLMRDRALWEVVADVLRRAPDEAIAPVAAVAALVAWQLGEGTRAAAALDRAHAADAAHSLARLVRRCLDAGLPPAVWQDVMAGLDESECRHGSRARLTDGPDGG